MNEAAVWLIIGLPMASFAAIGLVIRPFFNGYSRWAGYLAIAAIGGSFALSLWALAVANGQHAQAVGYAPHAWFSVGAFTFNVGVYLDSLSAIMVVVVTGVSLMVQIYSQGYMAGDRGYARYYALMSLFTAAMLGLVLSRNIIQIFVFWELVGASSYLLIGFWYQRASAARAAVKAFLVTRLADFGFLLAILYLFSKQGLFAAQGLNALEVPDIFQAVDRGVLAGAAVTWIAVGLFVGAAGKSAQFPFHTWLPDAMEGPTPVSALIHAATMVTAGVFLVARFFPLYDHSETAMTLVAVIGGVTAVFGATMAIVAKDIKRVIAYSTISQLGYMMLALGVGAYSAAIFHLFNNAFFKALLFLGSGSLNHASGTFNMDFMGGMGKYQRWTSATFIAASLSLAGLFPLAGFWSKDEIITEALRNGSPAALLVFVLALVAALMTAFYIFRAFFLTFTGQYRGGAEAEAKASPGSLPESAYVDLEPQAEVHHGGPAPSLPAGEHAEARPAEHGAHTGQSAPGHNGHLAESPWVMVAPMVLLAVMAVVSGALFNPPVSLGPIPAHWFSEFLVPPGGEFEGVRFNLGVAVVSVGLAAAGIVVAWLIYGRKLIAPEQVTIKPLQRLLSRRYYLDDLYENVLTGRLFLQGVCLITEWIDRNIVDGLMDTVGWLGRNLGRGVAVAQTGQLQVYATVFAVGVLAAAVAYMVWG